MMDREAAEKVVQDFVGTMNRRAEAALVAFAKGDIPNFYMHACAWQMMHTTGVEIQRIGNSPTSTPADAERVLALFKGEKATHAAIATVSFGVARLVGLVGAEAASHGVTHARFPRVAEYASQVRARVMTMMKGAVEAREKATAKGETQG